MRKFGEFFKRIKVDVDTKTYVEKNKDINDIHIQIEGNINLFKDEEQKIFQGAKQLLELDKADNMQDAIITFAVMFRGLKLKEIKMLEDGKTVVILKETAQRIKEETKQDNEIDL